MDATINKLPAADLTAHALPDPGSTLAPRGAERPTFVQDLNAALAVRHAAGAAVSELKAYFSYLFDGDVSELSLPHFRILLALAREDGAEFRCVITPQAV